MRNKIIAKSLVAAICICPVLPRLQGQSDRARLAAILKKSAEYCRRLDQAALDFICLEEVTEFSRHYTPHTDVYLYDYQFIRKNEETKERRNLIAVNGKKADVQDSWLHTVMFQYKNVLFGPVGLLSKSWQAYYEYQLVGEDTIHNEKAVVVEATPGPMPVEPHLYGKIWIKEDDGSVLKIVWDQKSLGNFQSIEEWAKAHEAEPRITAFSEYGFEKNGLRFPSRSYTEQAYIRKDKPKFANAEISIFYKDYKFFTVETEIKY
jgi:hypothetical protein